MHYFTKEIAPDVFLTATCEDVNAARLIPEIKSRGFVECLHAAWSAARAEQDRQPRLVQEIMPPSCAAAQDEPAPVVVGPAVADALPTGGRVYASSIRH
jgi:hypothetical protein